MATPGDSSDEEDAELADLDEDIGKLRSAKKVLFDLSRPISDELERIREIEQQLVDKYHHLTTEQHYREKHQQTVQRVIELESQLKQAESENVRLKQSLDQAAKHSKSQWRKIAELETTAKSGAVSEEKRATFENTATAKDSLEEVRVGTPPLYRLSGDRPQLASFVHDWTATEPQEQLRQTTKLLNETKEELNKTRQRLSEVQNRLTLAEQVTAATQQRALQECDDSEQLQQQTTSSASACSFI